MIRNLTKEDLSTINFPPYNKKAIRYDLSFVNDIDGNIVSYVILRNIRRRKRSMHWTMFSSEWDTVEFAAMNCKDFEEQCTFFMRIIDATKYEYLFVWDAGKNWNDFHKNLGMSVCRVCPIYYTFLMECGALLLNQKISLKVNEYKRANNNERK